jgi:DNA-binding transcriptional MerR regulator
MHYSVKRLSELAGVSVRTLHLYDQLGLLKPSVRTEARYRLYGEPELLRLQQILFYRELDFPLKEIGQILDSPDFDRVQALESHKTALLMRQHRIATLLTTLDKTIDKLKTKAMLNHEELYEGLPKEKAEAYRQEAIAKWGADTVEHSENYLRKLTKNELNALKADLETITQTLFSLKHEDPASETVQAQIARHYAIIRTFWGTAGLADKPAEAYASLGQLYLKDERYTVIDGKPDPEFAQFLSHAMSHFAETRLK